MPIIETHPFAPILPPHASVMMMGTFPPKAEKRCMEFHYPNFYNDMWRIYGLVFFNNAEYFQLASSKSFDPKRIVAFLHERGIALCPTVRRAIREQDNASDKFLTIVEPVNLDAILQQVPDCKWLITTGGKATDILLSLLPEQLKLKTPKTNTEMAFPYHGRDLRLYRLPSTSRAYPLSLVKKAEAYHAFYQMIGMV